MPPKLKKFLDDAAPLVLDKFFEPQPGVTYARTVVSWVRNSAIANSPRQRNYNAIGLTPFYHHAEPSQCLTHTPVDAAQSQKRLHGDIAQSGAASLLADRLETLKI